MKTHGPCLALLSVGATCLAAGIASADPIADFYRGKQMQIIVRSAPGGSFDLYSRLVANHMMKHIPGHPTFILRHMT